MASVGREPLRIMAHYATCSLLSRPRLISPDGLAACRRGGLYAGQMTEAAEGGRPAGSVEGQGTRLKASAWVGVGYALLLGGFGATALHRAALRPHFRVTAVSCIVL